MKVCIWLCIIQPISSALIFYSSYVSITVMRSLGIPTRSITNYDSAHDTDNNLTFDKYFDEEGEYEDEKSDDSCWYGTHYCNVLLNNSSMYFKLLNSIKCLPTVIQSNLSNWLSQMKTVTKVSK